MRRRRRTSSSGVRHAGAVFCGPLAPASIGDYLAGPNHVLPTFGSARYAGALTVRRLPQAPPRGHRLARRPRRGSPPTSPAWPGPRASTPTPARCCCARSTTAQVSRVTRPPGPRRPGGHGGLPLAPGRRGRAPQHQRVAVPAPGRVPPAAGARPLEQVDWHRYPDRAARDLRAGIAALHGVDAEPGLRRQRLQRGAADPAAGLRGAGPHGRHVRADLRPARPHRPDHRRDGGRGRPGRRLRPGARPRSTASSTSSARRSCSSARPTTPPGCWSRRSWWPRSPTGPSATGSCWWSTRPTGSSRRGRRCELVDEERPLVVTRTYSKTWSMAAARLGYLVGPSWLVDELEKVVLPYHLDVPTQLAGTLALRLRRRDERAGRLRRGGARPPAGRAWPTCR